MSYCKKRKMWSFTAGGRCGVRLFRNEFRCSDGPSGGQQGSTVDVLAGPFGPMLVAGSGPSSGTALYVITSDHGSTFGCTTTKQSVGGQPYVCTGPSTSTARGLARVHDHGHSRRGSRSEAVHARRG